MRLALDLEDYHPSVLLHCWLGHLTCKIVSEMTYNVLSGTLNPTNTIQYNTMSLLCVTVSDLTLGPVKVYATYPDRFFSRT